MMLILKGLAAIGTAAGLYKLVGIVREKYNARVQVGKVRSRNPNPEA